MDKNCIKNNVAGHIRDLVIVVIIGNFVAFLFNSNWSDFVSNLGWSSLYSLIIGGTLWKGNEALGYFISLKIDRNKEPLKLLRWNLLGMFIYSTLAIIMVNYIWWVIIFGRQFGLLFSQQWITMIIEMVITVIIVSIIYSFSFFKAWRASAVSEERLKKESIALQYKALQNQVNPHFLFNSLNTLSSLVYKDQETAVKFIKELSDVYRYVLEMKDNEVIDLSTELQFVNHYIYLQKIRYGNNLKVEMDIKDGKENKVVPMSLQMVIENAIKHNIVSEENPLLLEIMETNDYIIVKNNLQRKSAVKDSGGIGLQNLQSRYDSLSDKKFSAEATEKEFIVKIPLIKSAGK